MVIDKWFGNSYDIIYRWIEDDLMITDNGYGICIMKNVQIAHILQW